jgi:hypothetical protein
MLLVKQLQRNFKLALADKTPRSNYVGYDVDLQRLLRLFSHCDLSLSEMIVELFAQCSLQHLARRGFRNRIDAQHRIQQKTHHRALHGAS